jgi:biotin carboxyl carrier protein
MEVGVERKIKNPIEPLNIKPVRKSTPMDQAKPDRPVAMQSLKGNEIIAPLPGLIIAVQVKAGDRIKANQTLIKMEAMKMENEIKADRDGVVKEVLVKVGDAVLENAPLIVIGD